MEATNHQVMDEEQLSIQRVLDSRRYDTLFDPKSQDVNIYVSDSSDDSDSSNCTDNDEDTDNKATDSQVVNSSNIDPPSSSITSSKDIIFNIISQYASKLISSYFPIALTNVILYMARGRSPIIFFEDQSVPLYKGINLNNEIDETDYIAADMRDKLGDITISIIYNKSLAKLKSVRRDKHQIESVDVLVDQASVQQYYNNTDEKEETESTIDLEHTYHSQAAKKESEQEEWHHNLWRHNTYGSINPLLYKVENSDAHTYRSNRNAYKHTLYIPYKLTSNQLFRNLCFNDVILHFINLIKIYNPKVLNLQKFQDRKENFQLVIDTIDYIIFELDKFDDFIKYQVLPNNVNITNGDDDDDDDDQLQFQAAMDEVFESIPQEWRFIVVFKRGILEETVFVNFGDIGGAKTKVSELNDSLTKFYKLPIFNKSLLVIDGIKQAKLNKVSLKIEELIDRYSMLTKEINVEFKLTFKIKEIAEIGTQLLQKKEQKDKENEKEKKVKEKKDDEKNSKEKENDVGVKAKKPGKKYRDYVPKYEFRVNKNFDDFWYLETNISAMEYFEQKFRTFVFKTGIPNGWFMGYNSNKNWFELRGIKRNEQDMVDIINQFCKQMNINQSQINLIVNDRKEIEPRCDHEQKT